MTPSTDSSKGDLVKKGQLLIRQGEEPRFMYYMHSGALEILSAPPEYEELHTDILLSKSKRVGTIKEKNLISGLSILFAEPYKKSIRAIEDSYISKYPIKEGGFQQIVTDNTPLAVDILSNLFRRLELSIPDASRYTSLYQNIARINDNICLVYKALSQGPLPEKLQPRADAIYDTYVLNGGSFPGSFDAKFVIADNSGVLKKKYSFPGLPMETILDLKQCNFINKFIKLDINVLIGVVKRDPSIATYMFETISDNLLKVLDRIEAIHTLIDDELTVLFGQEGSWTSVLIDSGAFATWQRTGRLTADFLKNFLSVAVKVHSFFEELSGKKLSEIFPGFKKLHELYVSQKDKGRAEERPAVRKVSSLGKDYVNSIQQIFEFSLIDKEFQKNFLKVLNDFKKMQNPFNTEPEGRKIRRFITKLYLDLYKQVLLRSHNESTMPAPVRLMLNFGFLDETMLEQEQIEELHEISMRSAESSRLPIYHEHEFLKRIYDGKENPSITEMGLTYEAHLREEEKHKKKGQTGKPGADEESINKMMYEIDHRLLNTITVCSGSTATAFPILSSLVMRGNPANFILSKKKLESTVLSLREIDFSAFYRETVERIGEAREIIQDEVIPNFILLPSFGTKTMLWQELDGTNRRTRGRIVIPILFMGDIVKSLAHTIACFRWELNRSLKGAMWADPVEGGLTGIYFDYVNFFKKNPNGPTATASPKTT
ncbi:MAG: cyclic nucleotide-binding domain-containing protein [Spirochaetes bacterium]|nr:cyclic nucleotide-binding domain-containing protein [Spirochaetota bacterium]